MSHTPGLNSANDQSGKADRSMAVRGWGGRRGGLEGQETGKN